MLKRNKELLGVYRRCYSAVNNVSCKDLRFKESLKSKMKAISGKSE